MIDSMYRYSQSQHLLRKKRVGLADTFKVYRQDKPWETGQLVPDISTGRDVKVSDSCRLANGEIMEALPDCEEDY